MTLEQFFRDAAADSVHNDFRLVVAVHDKVTIYIHPLGRNGDTTPSLVVDGNTVRLVQGSYSPKWPE